MNKYQKALSLVIELIEIDNGCAGIFFKYNGEMFEAIDILKELVEKAIPKKPNKRYYDNYYCPECHKQVFMSWKECKHCNQNLDWSDEE